MCQRLSTRSHTKTLEITNVSQGWHLKDHFCILTFLYDYILAFCSFLLLFFLLAFCLHWILKTEEWQKESSQCDGEGDGFKCRLYSSRSTWYCTAHWATRIHEVLMLVLEYRKLSPDISVISVSSVWSTFATLNKYKGCFFCFSFAEITIMHLKQWNLPDKDQAMQAWQPFSGDQQTSHRQQSNLDYKAHKRCFC